VQALARWRYLPGAILSEVACLVELGEQCISRSGRSAVKLTAFEQTVSEPAIVNQIEPFQDR